MSDDKNENQPKKFDEKYPVTIMGFKCNMLSAITIIVVSALFLNMYPNLTTSILIVLCVIFCSLFIFYAEKKDQKEGTNSNSAIWLIIFANMMSVSWIMVFVEDIL